MIITKTVEVPANRHVHIDFEVPREVPEGKARIELKVIPFVKKVEKSTAKKSPKFNLTKKELDEMLEKSPITRELTGILSGFGNITIEQIRDERLAKYLQ